MRARARGGSPGIRSEYIDHTGNLAACEGMCELRVCPISLVERAEEISCLEQLYAECAQGRGNIALISGPVAGGKTALLQRFADHVESVGGVFLKATASLAEYVLPLEVVGQLTAAAGLLAERGDVAAPPPGARAAAPPAVESVVQSVLGVSEETAEPDPRRLGRILFGLAERGPLVVGVDDVHYADPRSLQCLLYLARRLPSTRVLLVLTEEALLQREYPRFRAELFRQPHCHHLRLKPLSKSGVAALLAGYVGRFRSRQLATACHRISGGNPLLARALAEDHLNDATENGELTPGPAFSQAVATCLYRCEPAMLRTAKALAVVGDYASPEVLGEVVALDPEMTEQALSGLNAVGLLDGGGFRHPAVTAAVRQTTRAGENAALHGRAARILHGHGVSAARLAPHLVAAGRVSEPWGVPVLREAATEALAGDRIGFAVDCLSAAARAATDEDEQTAIRMALARAKWRVNPLAAARHLPELTAAARAGRMTPDDMATLIGLLVWHGSSDEATAVLELLDQRERAGTCAETVEGAELIRLWLGFAHAGQFGRVRPEVEAAEAAPAPGSRPTRAAALLSAVLTRGADEDTVTRAEQILQGARLDDATLLTEVATLSALMYADRLDEAGHWCDTLLREAGKRGALTWQAFFATVRADISVRQGRIAAAEEPAHLALSLISPGSWGVAIGAPIANMVLVTTALGRYDEAAAYLNMPVPEGAFQNVAGLRYLAARGRYYMAVDRPHAALDDFWTCGDLMRKWGADIPTVLPWRTDLAGACLALGKRDQARDLALEQLARLGAEYPSVRAQSLRVLARAGDAAKAPALLHEAVENLSSAGQGYELALTVAELSRAYHALRDETRARLQARRAYRIAEDCDMELPRGILPREIVGAALPFDGVGTPVDDPVNELSDAELRVAALASQGHTNRQIASKLFVTVSTVEQHLTRVYRKLNVSRRTDLPLELPVPGDESAAAGG